MSGFSAVLRSGIEDLKKASDPSPPKQRDRKIEGEKIIEKIFQIGICF